VAGNVIFKHGKCMDLKEAKRDFSIVPVEGSHYKLVFAIYRTKISRDKGDGLFAQPS
jgi:hypothetical protein